ncbi:MAG: polyprenyl synthetase family protein [Chloroflexi bacterium]|nr:polyprenyl synthetase family protein [Chloroflexota bacterium]MCI0577681.1 polyprenyl synthetase family protein [Chloroflexota bacterium]MCI0644599.1 polyprenyl synthetase family protein [Chloroflexota bacterium]MCI0728249.1 polyprenyl synthetase family protein [Chloroflexota bacterium]
MDTYTLVVDFVLALPPVRSWTGMSTLLERAAHGKPHDWQLPLLACEAVGGRPNQAIPAAAAVACSQISIILVDDMLDADARGEYHQVGLPAAANLAVAFQVAGLEALAHSSAPSETRLAALQAVRQMALTTALGQHWDTQNPADEAAYWRLVQTKSSPFFEAALYAGALLGGASPELAGQLKQFGHVYGQIIQIHDDLNDAMATPANADWLAGRSPLPILFAQVVDHPGRERFLQLRQAIPRPEALAEAQKILIRCGAVSYCVDQLLRRYQAAQRLLAAMPLAAPGRLAGLLEPVISPVQALLTEIGVSQPVILQLLEQNRQ